MSSPRLDGATLDAAWDFGDPAGSEQRLRDLRERLGTETTAGQEVSTQIARALGLQGRFDEARTLLETIDAGDPIVQARLALERGRLHNSSGEPAAAAPWFQQAAQLANTGGDDYLRVDALHMLAIADPAQSAHWTETALGIVQSSDDDRARRWAGALYNNLGWSQHDAGRYNEALETFNTALSAYLQFGTPMQVHIASWSVARCLRSLGRRDEALTIQLRLQREDEPDSYVDEEIVLLREMPGESPT